MIGLIKAIFGTKYERDIRKLKPLIARINELAESYSSLSDNDLRNKTQEFRNRLAAGETLDDILCEAFATAKCGCKRLCGTRFDVCGHERVWEMVPFDVQLLGGIVLHHGKIAEMATGEGKTLVATMPLYLNALAGKGVHLVTHNDYLAKRDAQWMGLLYEFLGVSVGCIQNTMRPAERREAYSKDITYGTASEFGFDYLRDNGMAWNPEEQVQRGHNFAIVDEVDSILIDEARTPLIISGPAPLSSHQYLELKPRVEELVRKQRALCNQFVQEARKAIDEGRTTDAQLLLYQVKNGMPKHKQLMHILEEPETRRLLEQVELSMLQDLRKEQARELREQMYFTIDERGHDATLTEKGCAAMNPSDPDSYVLPDLVTAIAELEAEPGLSEKDKAIRRQEIQNAFSEKSERIHNVDQLIRAYCLYERDVQYVIQENQVLIVDEFTGRIMPGRRWSDGLHQAVEAKEGVKIERETQTLATITIQNYFRMYKKLAGMTGTAETEAGEFNEIYKLDVVVIPTNRPVRRMDSNDVIYKSQREKFKAVIEEIADCHKREQPVLVGTASVDTSELLSRMLKRAGIPHNVLNAKNHEREAEIVTRAGQPGAVTIATNMAGRGTDIKLGDGVVYISRDVITSGTRLTDVVEGGKTLREMLEERPCGLHVIGSERHESRRIDRQLRGRCARQGDPGSSRFYVSLEDDLMRLFGSDRIANIMSKMGLEEGQDLQHRWLNRSIETAQRRVEQQNFSIRKRTLEYDDVMNNQRTVIYGFRGDVVRASEVRSQIRDILSDVVSDRVSGFLEEEGEEAVKEFLSSIHSMFPIGVSADEVRAYQKSNDRDALTDLVLGRVWEAYELKVSLESRLNYQVVERHILLHAIDTNWQDYLRCLDVLRQGVGLRAYGQRDPLVEYKLEASRMFEELMASIKQDIAVAIFRSTTSVEAFESFLARIPKKLIHAEVSLLGHGAPANRAPEPAQAGGELPMPDLEEATRQGRPQIGPVRREEPKVGRNDPCSCGSGKKYKKCCGVDA